MLDPGTGERTGRSRLGGEDRLSTLQSADARTGRSTSRCVRDTAGRHVLRRGFGPNRAPTGLGAPGRYAPRVAQPSDVEARLAALEARMDVVAALEARMDIVAADAAAARHLAAARDRDLADLGVKVDANRAAINALGEQTAAGFAEMRGRLDAAAAGQQRIVDLLTGLISGQSDQQ